MDALLDDIVSANTRARLRVQDVINAQGPGASATDLCATLAHLAFWDGFYAARWELRKRGNRDALTELGSAVVDSINAAGAPMWRSLDLHAAARVVLRAAERVDAIVASLRSELVTEAESNGAHRMLARALHRNEHLDELERTSAGG